MFILSKELSMIQLSGGYKRTFSICPLNFYQPSGKAGL